MIQILVVFLIIAGGLLFVNLMTRKPKPYKIKEPEFCKLHEWAYDHMGKMICNECNYKPEDFQ